jgi:3-methyladenine DNA glycosylase AlkD
MGELPILEEFAKSGHLWRKRIAMISTFAFIKSGNNKPTYNIAKILLTDQHDLIHKAVGWMLREAGKNEVREL